MTTAPFGLPETAWPTMSPGGDLFLLLLALALGTFLLSLMATATRETWWPPLLRLGRRPASCLRGERA